MSEADVLALATEFEVDAELVERLAEIYRAKGMNLQYEVLWHEGAVYRSTADRMRSAVSESAGLTK